MSISYMSIPQWLRQDFGLGGGGTLDKISYINSSQVLYCNGVAKISVLKRHSARMYSSKTFEKKFEKFIKQFAQKFLKILQNFSKIKFNRI